MNSEIVERAASAQHPSRWYMTAVTNICFSGTSCTTGGHHVKGDESEPFSDSRSSYQPSDNEESEDDIPSEDSDEQYSNYDDQPARTTVNPATVANPATTNDTWGPCGQVAHDFPFTAQSGFQLNPNEFCDPYKIYRKFIDDEVLELIKGNPKTKETQRQNNIGKTSVKINGSDNPKNTTSVDLTAENKALSKQIKNWTKSQVDEIRWDTLNSDLDNIVLNTQNSVNNEMTCQVTCFYKQAYRIPKLSNRWVLSNYLRHILSKNIEVPLESLLKKSKFKKITSFLNPSLKPSTSRVISSFNPEASTSKIISSPNPKPSTSKVISSPNPKASTSKIISSLYPKPSTSKVISSPNPEART
ncbi:unnamed protein product [Brassicogethes aeneus]|uniref:Uncharacterized protein n=1 Tax=Brassicogethes aeneus TaxID=1431903 RepID=A0A9P0FPU6_BRAAE|nr:unnamed protein product [Brassicogethes aeneus]